MFSLFVVSLVSETYFSQSVSTHEAALVNISVDAVDVSFAGVLPHSDVAVVAEYRFLFGVLCYHEGVVVYLSCEIAVVEVGASVE